MWSHRRLLFVRQTGSSLPILEVCRFRFRQFSGSGDHSFQHISTKSHVQINSAMPTLYSMVNETKNRNRILEMCKFLIWLRLVHCGTITSVNRYGFSECYTRIRNVIDSTSGVSETINQKQISDFRGVRFRTFAVFGCDHHIFQRIGSKFPTELILSNADFVLSGK